MESKSYNFRELLSGCKSSNYMREFVLYFKLAQLERFSEKGEFIKHKRDGRRVRWAEIRPNG